jgi:hypothetical protein
MTKFESQLEMISRIQAMLDPNQQTWDLSEKDIEAIRFVASAFPNPRLVEALKAVILFHDPGSWDQKKEAEWLKLTGGKGSTTKELCDFIRERINEPYCESVDAEFK